MKFHPFMSGRQFGIVPAQAPNWLAGIAQKSAATLAR